MADLDITGRVVFDASQAESALDKIGDKADQMARDVSGAATKAGGAVDKIGDGANASAEKFTRAEARIADSIKRTTTSLELLGKTASQKLEFKISDKGLDATKFEPALQKLRELEAQSLRAGTTATVSLDKMGISAAQTAAALRGVPAQFTDIVTSLQGGQAPLTVFLQQGGQLKDMFGGAGNAARALGGYVLGLVNPFTLAAGAAAVLGLAYFQGSKEADAYNKALVTTGNASGTTAAQMQQMAQRISSVVGTQGAAAATLAQLAGSSRIAAENFEYFGTVALKVEKTVGTSVAETVKQFAELGKAPVEASKKLNDETNYLTQSIYEQIKALKDQGREAAAASLAQTAYADAINSRSDQMTQNLGLIERAWRGITGAAKGAWDAMLNVGRSDSLGDQLAQVRAQLEARMVRQNGRPDASDEKGNEKLRQQIGLLTEQERLLKRGSEAQAQRAQVEKAAIEATDALGKANEKALSKQEQMNKALADYRGNLEKVKAVNPNSALLDPAQVAKSEKAIREQFAERTKAVAAGNNELQKQGELIAKLSGLSPDFYKSWDRLTAIYKSGGLSLAELTQKQAELLALQPAMTAQVKAQADAEKERAKSAADLAKTLEAYAKAQQEGVAQGFQAAQQAEDQLAQYGLLKSEVQALTLAYLEQSRESAALAGEDVSNIDKRITAQKRLIAATSGIEQRDAAKKAAQDAESEWQRTADSINNSLTDALLRAFESGKDFAQALKTTVVNMFKTLVLRPIISAVVNPIAGALTGGLGLSGAAQAASGGSSALSSISSLAGVSSAITGGLSAGFAGLTGSIGGLFGAVGTGTTLGGALSAGSIALGAGNVAGGLATFAGALGPIALGIGALVTLAKKIDTSGTPHIGAGAVYSEYGGLQEGASIYNKATFGQGVAEEYAKATQEGVSTIAKTLTQTFDGIAKTFGKTAGYEIATAFADDSSKDGAWGSLRISQGGRDALNWAANPMREGVPREFANGEEGYKGYLAAIAKDTRQVLLDMDLPSWADTILESIGEAGSIEQLSAAVQQIGQIQTTFVQLGKTIEGFAGLSDSAFSALMKASGGFEALATSASAYYDNFYSEGEKAATVTRSVADALKQVGIDMPATREEFRALVETNLALGESGATAVAALLGVSGAFASVVPAAADAAKAIGNGLSETMRRLQSDSESLEVELLQAQGRESEATALRRSIEIKGFNDAEIAVYDHNASLRESIKATNAASAALKAYKTAASSISTSKDTLAGIVRSPVEIAQNALNATLVRLNETLKPANVVKDDYTYLSLYQDVLDFWKSESAQGGALAGVSAAEYAQIHYESSGKSEGRMSPQEALDLITTLVPNYTPLTLEDVLKIDTSGQGAYSAEQWEVIADVFAKAANVKLAAETPVTPATSVVDTSNAALSDILQERMTLQERYDALTMTSTQLLEKQRNALDESNRALFDSIQLEEKKATVAAERKGLQDQYDELTLTSAQLLERQRDALDESNRALFDSIQTIKSEAKAREDAEKAAAQALSNSFDGVQRAVDAQRKIYQVARDTAQESVSEITSVFDILKSSVKDLYGSVDSTAQMQAVQGRDFIRRALETAQTTGYLPDSKQLTEAINAAKGGTKEFATQFEKDLEALTLASDLSVMERLTKDQLTEAERMLGIADAQLDSLDGILELAKQQLDAANGINTSVLSVKEALSTFAAAIAAANATKTVVVPPTGTTPPPVGPRVPTYPTGTGGGGAGSTETANAAFFRQTYETSIRAMSASDIANFQGRINSGAVQLDDLQLSTWRSITGFANGGMHSGGLRWVGENGPELEATGPSRIWNAQQLRGAMGGGSNNARLEALVEGLTAEVQRLQAIVAQGVTHQRETAEILDNVTEGGNAMRSEVMP